MLIALDEEDRKGWRGMQGDDCGERDARRGLWDCGERDVGRELWGKG